MENNLMCLEYTYTSFDVLTNKKAYSKPNYLGENFLFEYITIRHKYLNELSKKFKINNASIPNFKEQIRVSDDEIKLLELKRTRYILTEDYDFLISLAFKIANSVVTIKNLQHLSSLLKINDILVNIPKQSLSTLQANYIYFSLNIELDLVRGLQDDK